jgi:hypothetical protein
VMSDKWLRTEHRRQMGLRVGFQQVAHGRTRRT